jgi:hypothetical protein
MQEAKIFSGVANPKGNVFVFGNVSTTSHLQEKGRFIISGHPCD